MDDQVYVVTRECGCVVAIMNADYLGVKVMAALGKEILGAGHVLDRISESEALERFHALCPHYGSRQAVLFVKHDLEEESRG